MEQPESSGAHSKFLFDALPIAAAITDIDGIVQSVNRPLVEFTGFAADEVVGRSVGSILLDKPGVCILENIRTVAASGQAWKGETVSQKSGQESPVEVTVSPIGGAKGTASRFLVTAVDVTERKRAEAASHLEVANHSRPVFTDSVCIGSFPRRIASADPR